MTWVRQDILDQAGLDVPKTVEELTAYMAAAQKINPDFKAGTRAWSGNKWEEPAMGFAELSLELCQVMQHSLIQVMEG